MGIVPTVSLAGLRQNAPQEFRVLMTPDLLLVLYCLALLGTRLWKRHVIGHRDRTATD